MRAFFLEKLDVQLNYVDFTVGVYLNHATRFCVIGSLL
jgi:hypothetical protein